MNQEIRPLVSVITVTYNSARYVTDTIESVLAQTYPHIEYIIGDDCSTDETWAIISRYKDARIRAYRNETNLREYPNRNKAIDMATGKYLIFIDGDDIIFPHGIGFFVSMMEAFPEAAMAIQKNYHNNVLFPAFFTPEETLRNNFYGDYSLLSSSFCSNFFRTDLLKKWKLNPAFIAGDQEIRMKLAARYPVLFVAGWVSWPRETPGQASSKLSRKEFYFESFQFIRDIFTAKDLPVDDRLVKDILDTCKRNAVWFSIRLLLQGKWKSLSSFLKITGFGLSDIIRYYSYKTIYTDVLKDYSPTAPFKKGFLNKIPSIETEAPVLPQ